MTVKILIAFVAVFVALAAVPAAAQTTGTATVGGTVEKRAWNLLSGHVWRGTDGYQYLNAGCQNIDPKSWGPSETSLVTLHLRFYIEGNGQNPFYETRIPGRRDGRTCDLRRGIDIVTWRLPSLTWGEGWENQPNVRIHLISRNRDVPHLGIANNALQTWARLVFGTSGNPYPGTGILNSQGEVDLSAPGDYER